MRVKMLQDAPGSPDGIRVVQYLKDEVHELGEFLASIFVSEGNAEPCDDEPAPAPATTTTPADVPPPADPADVLSEAADELPKLGTGASSTKVTAPAENK